MPEESILTDEFLRQLINVGEADILVGVPTYNNAATIGHVVQTIRAGLLKYFPRERAVIVNADGGSRDQTPDLVRGASINDAPGFHRPSGAAYFALHQRRISRRSIDRRRPCAPSWLPPNCCAPPPVPWSLPNPPPSSPTGSSACCDRSTRATYDFVTPLYRRHKFDGLLIRNLVYPMTRAFYGKRVKEPYASEFAFSGQLGNHFLGQEIWTHEAGRTGTEISLTISAITGGFRLAQTFLGAKPHAGRPLRRPGRRHAANRGRAVLVARTQLSSCGALTPIRRTIPTLAPGEEVTLEPLRVNRKRLLGMFHSGVAELEPVLKQILSPPILPSCKESLLSRKMSFPTATNSGPAPSTNSPLRITNRSSAATTSSRPWPRSIAEGHSRFWSRTANPQARKWNRTWKTFA